MAQCPKCGKEIDYLRNYSQSTGHFIVTLTKNGFLDYEHDSDSDYDTGVFCCPECDEELFSTEKEALAFLKT